MNYDAACPRKDGTWGYTSSNDGSTHGIGYCSPLKEMSNTLIDCLYGGDRERYDAYMAPYREADVQGKYHDGGHATSEEACACYKQYLLDFHLSFEDDQDDPQRLDKCQAEGCGAFTSGRARCGIGFPDLLHLCRDHRTREAVAPLVKVGASWHS